MTDQPNQPVRLSLLSAPANLQVVREALEQMCRSLGFGAEATGAVVLGVDEAMTNIIRHAYKGRSDGPIEVELTPVRDGRDGALEIRLMDRGEHADPLKLERRDLSEIRPGGLGVHIITECMDKVEYRPREGGGTTLVMVKKRQPQDSQSDKEISV